MYFQFLFFFFKGNHLHCERYLIPLFCFIHCLFYSSLFIPYLSSSFIFLFFYSFIYVNHSTYFWILKYNLPFIHIYSLHPNPLFLSSLFIFFIKDILRVRWNIFMLTWYQTWKIKRKRWRGNKWKKLKKIRNWKM